MNKRYHSIEKARAFYGVEKQRSCEEHAVDCNSNSFTFSLSLVKCN